MLTISSLLWGALSFFEAEFRKSDSSVLLGKESLIYILCVVVGIANVFIFNYLRSEKLIRNKISKDVTPEGFVKNITNKKSKDDLISKLSQIDNKELKLYSLLPFLISSIVLCMGLNNLISFLGYLLMISDSTNHSIWLLVSLSFVLSLYMRPNIERYLDTAQKLIEIDNY